MKIHHINARQILDSRGNPTVEADVWLDNGVYGRAAVPSGASTGSHEAHELRDGDEAYGGLGVARAVENIHGDIQSALKGIAADDQFLIDETMIKLDGTENKSRLGANAMLAVSLAAAHAAAKSRGVILYQHINDIAGKPPMSLPMPMMNVLNGGKHATGSSDFQEFMIVPVGARTMAEAVQIGSEVFQALKKLMGSVGYSTAVGDEGGFTYPLTARNTEMLEILEQAVEFAGYTVGMDVVFAIDVAASEFYEEGRYTLQAEQRTLSPDEMIDYLTEIVHTYPVVSVEDGLAEDEWAGWTQLTERLGATQLVGDDLLVTNKSRLERAIQEKAANAILIKPNQIGTLTETLRAIELAQKNGWRTIISHRSGETEDVTIAHIAIGTGAGQIKTGSLSRSERVAKYNELMRLEEIDKKLHLSQPFSS
jgi:enolase